MSEDTVSYTSDYPSVASGDSFWDVGNYRRVVDRVSAGAQLCDDLASLLRDRSDLERSYAKRLGAWSSKWEQFLEEKSSEFGTLRNAMKSILVEAENMSAVHMQVSQKIVSDIEGDVNKWKKENFHKSMIHYKEAKRASDGFEKAQKPWAKLKSKTDKYRGVYHSACSAAEKLTNKLSEAQRDQALNPEECMRLRERLVKATDDVRAAKEKYLRGIDAINQYNGQYMAEMTAEFEYWQHFERQRIEYFKTMLLEYHAIVDIYHNPDVPRTLETLRAGLQAIDAQTDLEAFSDTRGVGMPMEWPQFEEFSGGSYDEMRDSVNVGSRPASHSAPPRSVPVAAQGPPPAQPRYGAPPTAQPPQPAAYQQQPEYDDEWDEEEPQYDEQYDQEYAEQYDEYAAEPVAGGNQVRALYDYDGVDAEELSFRVDDIIDQIEPEDDQGWCRGSLNGRSGIYPASYVEYI